MCSLNSYQNNYGVNCGQLRINCSIERRQITLIFIVLWKMFAPQLIHVHSRSRQYGAHASARFYFDIDSSKYNIKIRLRHEKLPRDTHCFMLTVFDIDGVEMRRNTEKKMLGMKNHFDISGSIEIRQVDIAGVACI